MSAEPIVTLFYAAAGKPFQLRCAAAPAPGPRPGREQNDDEIHLGLVVTPALDAEDVEKLLRDLERMLAERYPGVNWKITAVRESLLPPAWATIGWPHPPRYALPVAASLPIARETSRVSFALTIGAMPGALPLKVIVQSKCDPSARLVNRNTPSWSLRIPPFVIR